MLTSCFFGAMRSVNPYELSLLTQNISFPPTRVFALLDYFSFLQQARKKWLFFYFAWLDSATSGAEYNKSFAFSLSLDEIFYTNTQTDKRISVSFLGGHKIELKKIPKEVIKSTADFNFMQELHIPFRRRRENYPEFSPITSHRRDGIARYWIFKSLFSFRLQAVGARWREWMWKSRISSPSIFSFSSNTKKLKVKLKRSRVARNFGFCEFFKSVQFFFAHVIRFQFYFYYIFCVILQKKNPGFDLILFFSLLVQKRYIFLLFNFFLTRKRVVTTMHATETEIELGKNWARQWKISERWLVLVPHSRTQSHADIFRALYNKNSQARRARRNWSEIFCVGGKKRKKKHEKL